MLRRAFAGASVIIYGAFCATLAFSQNYPDHPIRLVASSAGGGADFAARLLAQGLTASMGQQVVVDNRGGSGGIVAANIVRTAPPDGHTLLIYGSTLWIAQLMRKKSPYDVVRDFAPVTLVARTPSVLVVTPSLPVKSVKELIAFAKAKPGVLNYGAGGIGATGHLAAELFKSMADIDIVHVNYKGNAAVVNDLLAGQIQVTFGIVETVAPHIKSGRLTALAVTSMQPSALLPGVPTVAASGLPGYEALSLHAVFAPVKTPTAIVSRLNHEFVRLIRTAEIKERFLKLGVEAVGSTSKELASQIASGMARMDKVIKSAGIRID